MIEAVKYPINATSSGDIETASVPEDIAVTRGYLLVDIRIGERLMLPDYGNDLYPFSPNTGDSSLEASILESNLNTWCVPSGELYQFLVEDRSINDIDFFVNVVFPE